MRIQLTLARFANRPCSVLQRGRRSSSPRIATEARFLTPTEYWREEDRTVCKLCFNVLACHNQNRFIFRHLTSISNTMTLARRVCTILAARPRQSAHSIPFDASPVASTFSLG